MEWVSDCSSLPSLKTIYPVASKPAVYKVTYGVKALFWEGLHYSIFVKDIFLAMEEVVGWFGELIVEAKERGGWQG